LTPHAYPSTRKKPSVPDLSYLQALVLGAVQGDTELFPISSLGRSVLVPSLMGSSWKHLVSENAASGSRGSAYLSFVDAAKFSFLLATPVVLAAGVSRLPSLAGPATANSHGQVVLGALTASLAAYGSVRFLTRYVTTRTLTPLAIYSLVAGVGCLLWFGTSG
jgi:undecaprenyl pyrophosphate phosphatase UppP